MRGVNTAASAAFALSFVCGGEDRVADAKDGDAPGVKVADSTFSFFFALYPFIERRRQKTSSY